MKTLVLSIALFASILANADVNCISGNIPVNLSISSANRTYKISVLGFRINYSATYMATKKSGSHSEGHLNLKKVTDQSTWKNMPPSLILSYKVSNQRGYSYELTGLGGILAGPILFNPMSCD